MTRLHIPATPAHPSIKRRELLSQGAAWAATTAAPWAALALGGCQGAVPLPPVSRPVGAHASTRRFAAPVPDNAASQVAHRVLGSNPFALGVASGSARDTSVVIWTRLIAPDGDPAALPATTVRWELAHDEGLKHPVHTGTVRADAAWAHSVHAVVQGLEPDRVYFYRFRAGEAVSAVGRTRTTPAPGAAAARWRLALASCQRWEHGLYAAWRHMQADAPDAVVFVGDYIYEYASAPTALRRVPGGAAVSLADYRARYAAYKTDPHLQAMHAAAPWWVTWDDHEVENDYAGVQGGNAGQDSAAFMARRRAAYQAFYEHMPLRPEVLTQGLAGLDVGAELRLYGYVDLGALARLVLLDTRQYRHAQVCNRLNAWGSSTLDPTQCAAWLDPQRSLLGHPQEAWLAQALREGAGQGKPWLVLAQTTLLGELNHSTKPQRRLWNDAWDGYAPARQRLTQHLAGLRRSHPGSVPLVLGGDVHESWVGRVLADYARPDSAAVGVELCGTSISSHSSHTAEQMALRLANNPHFDWADTTHRGYTLLDLTPQGATALVRGLDDVRKAHTPVSTLARFVVEPGRAAVHRAG